MPALEATLLLLITPFGALALSGLAALRLLSDLKSRDPQIVPSSARRRLAVYLAPSVTIPVFGLVVWLQIASLEGRGVLSARDLSLVSWTLVVYGWAGTVVIGVRAWILSSRLPQLMELTFSRVNSLATAPVSLAIFALVVDVLVLGRLPLATAVSETQVASVVTALSAYILCTLVLPVTTAIANRIEDIVTPRNFLLLLGLSNVGTYPVLAALLWAWLQISAL